MSTWHQRAGLRRQREENPVKFVNPFAHATEWRVMEDPPNGMMCGLGTFPDKGKADELAAAAPHRFVVPPRSVMP